MVATATVIPSQTWKEFMEQQERLYVQQILEKVGGQVSAAHQLMGISRKSLYDKINKYEIELHRLREKN
jgi:two-component system C4-dicarboxylate transport response regulator DctD